MVAKNVAIQHAGHRHALGSSFHSGCPPDGFHQRFAVMLPGAPDQRAVDIKQHQCIGWFQASTIASSPGQPGKGEESTSRAFGLPESWYRPNLLQHS